MTARRIALALALVLTLAILASLFLLYKPMYPIRRGNATDFWRIAADVNRDGSFSGGWDGSAIPHGGGWIYTVVSSEYIDYYQVSDSEVNADGPRVVAALEKHANDPDPNNLCGEIYRVWKAQGGGLQVDGDIAFGAEQVHLAHAVPHSDRSATAILFDRFRTVQVARNADRYWAAFAFEALSLNVMVWFALWPFVRSRSLFQKLLHVAVIPALFYLPYWLGYCTLAGDWNGPVGGILYPHLYCHTGSPLVHVSWEYSLFEQTPPLLSAINQGYPTSYGHTLHWSHVHGPCDILLRSLILTATVALGIGLLRLHRFRAAHRQLRRPGFPVVTETPPPPS